MSRLTAVIAGLALLALACDSGGETTTSRPTATSQAGEAAVSTTTGATVPGAPQTTEVPETVAAPEPAAVDVLGEFITHIADGDAGAAFDLLAPDAVWSIGGGIEFRLGEPIAPDLAWLPGPLGVAGFSNDELVRGFLDLQVALKSRLSIAGCEGDRSAQTCDYAAENALTPMVGAEERGSLTVEVSGGLIDRYETEGEPLAGLRGVGDEFKRWAAIRDPDVTRELSLLAWAEIVVPLVEAWESAGRPDGPPPPALGDDPVALAQAFIDARNRGDWETMVALMGGQALDDPFGSRDEFDAAQLLERDITLEECEIVLESTTAVLVGCRVSVSDIIVNAAGIKATNPNQSTFQVADGRVVALPQFLPSSFIAESAIEDWATANAAEAYGEACPEGIAGQSPIDGLACAEFIADNQTGWLPVVSALDL